MIYRLAAELVILVHFAFVAFVVLGALLVPYRPRIAFAHVPAVIWGAATELLGIVCPLTPLEQRLWRQAGETGYVPMGLKEKLVGWTTLASPGESVEMTFVVPAAGEYTYVCLFPGHSNNMLGTFRSLK